MASIASPLMDRPFLLYLTAGDFVESGKMLEKDEPLRTLRTPRFRFKNAFALSVF